MAKQFSELNLLMKYDYSDKEPNLLVDVGAHIGSFSMPFAIIVRIYAICTTYTPTIIWK